jgi:hypothetical protein
MTIFFGELAKIEHFKIAVYYNIFPIRYINNLIDIKNQIAGGKLCGDTGLS